MERLLNSEEMAAYLGFRDPETVIQLIHRDSLPAYRIGPQYRFSLSAVNDWLRERSVVGQGAVVRLREKGAA